MKAERYSRSVLVEGYDQEKNEQTKVVIVGCGAVGNYVALGMAGFGVEKITLIDPDTIEESNLNRQLVFTNDDIQDSKAFALKARLQERMPEDGETILEASDEWVTEDNIDSQIPNDTDVVFACVDNINARLLLNDYCIKNKIVLINGGTSKGWGGEVCTVIPGKTACLRCYMKPDDAKGNCSKEENPSIVSNSILVASLMLTEFKNWITGKPTIPPVMKYVTGKMVSERKVLDAEEAKKVPKIPQPFYYMKVNPREGCICRE